MMYASKITINYEPKKVRYCREVELPDKLLTLNDISQHLQEGEEFSFTEGGLVTLMVIYGTRLETAEEVKLRVQAEEQYNKNYEIFHAKYDRK